MRIHRGRRRTHGDLQVGRLGGRGQAKAEGARQQHGGGGVADRLAHGDLDLVDSAKGHRAFLPVGSLK
ncbi:hypothetical protein D3C87_1681590 [compost metagenome]